MREVPLLKQLNLIVEGKFPFQQQSQELPGATIFIPVKLSGLQLLKAKPDTAYDGLEQIKS